MSNVDGFLRKIYALSRKEIYHIIRDFRGLYLSFFLPILLTLLFGYALSLDVENVEIAVLDYDRSLLSRDFIRHLEASPYFHVTAHFDNDKTLSHYLDAGKVAIIITIPHDFSENIKSNRKAPIQVILDGSDPNFANIALAYITAFIEKQNKKLLMEFLNWQGIELLKPPLEARFRIWFNEDLESRNLIVPGIIGVIIMIAGAMITSLVIAREYENGTMETIKTLPISAGEFFFGKALPYFFITLVDVLIAILLGQLLFGIVMKGNFWVTILTVMLYLWVAISLGLLISTVAKSQLIANQIAPLVTFLPSMLLSDFIFPITNMPAPIQPISYVVPATYFIDVLKCVYLKDLPLSMIWTDIIVLLLMASLLGFLTWAQLRKEGLE
ncbi:MAG: ABC transporter permease [Syntrophales bacterium]|nr:ABC transporter permease [Syntrophales bacterium]